MSLSGNILALIDAAAKAGPDLARTDPDVVRLRDLVAQEIVTARRERDANATRIAELEAK